MSLEKPSKIEDDKWNGPDGWGGTHLCKDWSAVKDVINTYGIPQTALVRPPPKPDDEDDRADLDQ
jgi:hypothetical protein